MQIGMQNACYFVICLTPLYLTRPNCLRELRWALDMCAAKESTRKMLVLALHPAVSRQGCARIINAAGRAAHVFLPVNDRLKTDKNRLDQWIGHKLSQEAILLLKRLTGQDAVGIQADWLKLQPWLSDDLARDWEEESPVWAEEDAVTLDSLLKRYLPDMLVCITRLPACSDFCFAKFANDELASDPPSQDVLARSDASVIRDCYQRSQTLFSENELVSLLRLGLSDVDIMACVEHGFKKLSVVETQTSEDDVVRIHNPLDSAFRLAACMSGVNFDDARKSWLAYNQLYVGSDRRDPLLQKDPEHQNYCKAARMLEKVTAGIIPRIEEEFEGLHTVCLREVMSQKPPDIDELAWQQSSVALQAWKTALLRHHRDSEICKAASMLEKVESGQTPQHENDPNSLYAKLLPQVMSLKPTDVDEDAWRRSSEKLLQAWKKVLLERLSSDELTKDVDVKHFFRNVPDHHANKLWSIEQGPHQIAKTFCDKGAGEVKRICELDSAKIFNTLQFCKQFPDKFKPAAKAANQSRNIMAHLENSSPKMSNEQYRFIFDSMKKLLQCLDDPSKSLLLKDIQDLDAKELQMVDVASVNNMQKEIEFLRRHVAYLSTAGQAKKFSLHLRAEHSLQVFPNISRAGYFTCKVRIADAAAAVGDYVAGAAVDAGTCLFRASDSLDGYISKISLIDGIGAGDSKAAMAAHTSALIGQDALIDVVILKMHAFSFPTLEREAQRQSELIATLQQMMDSEGCEAAFKKIAGEVKGKLQKSLKLSDSEQRFWDAFGRSPEEAARMVSPSYTPTAKAVVSPSSTPTAKGAAGKSGGIVTLSKGAPAATLAHGGSRDVAHSSDEKSVGSDVSTPEVSSPAAPTSVPRAVPRALPDLLELFGIGSWLPISKQKAWAQLIPNKPGPLSPQDEALFPFLEIDALARPEQSKWIEGERVKFEAAKLTKGERQTLREYALEPSQTENDMLRLLGDRVSFRGVSDSSMSHRARFDLVKKHEAELVTVFPLKGDREFLLKWLNDCAGKLSASPVADASAAVSATVSTGTVLKTLAAPSSASALFASALLEHPAAPSTIMPLATGGATSSPAAALDDDTADLERLVELLARAKVVPPTKRSQFARKLLDQGVCGEQAILTSINADPPDFDLVEDIGMTASQKRCLETYLKNFKL
jgi:hypothetical protein